jgi:hypothetical protein
MPRAARGAAKTMRHHVRKAINGLKAFLLARDQASAPPAKAGGSCHNS